MSITFALQCDKCDTLKSISSNLPEDDELDEWEFDYETYYTLCPNCREDSE